MSIFGSIMGDFDEDPFFGSHMRHMHHMNNMMNSMFADPFGMLGGMGGPLAITGRHQPHSMMPFMPQIPMPTPPSVNVRLLTGGLNGEMMGGHCNSYSSSTIVMSNGPDGRPQVISSSSSTQLGPNGVKETRRTLQDSRTGTKKMAIGHHIGERAHVIEREQNVHSGDNEEHQEFINIDEEEADDFNREFQQRSSGFNARGARQQQRAILGAPVTAGARHSPQLALTAPNTSPRHSLRRVPSARRPLRQTYRPSNVPVTSNPTPSSVARQTYGSVRPQTKHHLARHHHKKHHDASNN